MRAVFCFLRNDPTEILFFSPTAVHLCWEEKSTRPGLSCIHLITFLWQSQHVKLDSMFSRPYTPRSASTVTNWSLGGSVIVRTTLLCIVTFNCSIFSRFPSDQAEMEALLSPIQWHIQIYDHSTAYQSKYYINTVSIITHSEIIKSAHLSLELCFATPLVSSNHPPSKINSFTFSGQFFSPFSSPPVSLLSTTAHPPFSDATLHAVYLTKAALYIP